MNVNKNFLFIFSIASSVTFGQQTLTKSKSHVIATIEKHQSNLIKISDDIWSLAETAFEEHKSSKI